MPLFDKNVCVRQNTLRNSFMLVYFFSVYCVSFA